jgi:hypothetical protein
MPCEFRPESDPICEAHAYSHLTSDRSLHLCELTMHQNRTLFYSTHIEIHVRHVFEEEGKGSL